MLAVATSIVLVCGLVYMASRGGSAKDTPVKHTTAAAIKPPAKKSVSAPSTAWSRSSSSQETVVSNDIGSSINHDGNGSVRGFGKGGGVFFGAGNGDGSDFQAPPTQDRKHVLFVLPSRFWGPDFFPVESALKKGGVAVAVGCVTLDDAISQTDGSRASPTVKLSQANPDDFDAIIICGGEIHELIFSGAGAADIRRLVTKMDARGRIVAAICKGPIVLAHHGVLNGKRATCYGPESQSLRAHNAVVTSEPVVVDGHIITGRSADDAEAFVRELLQQLWTR
jgi:putative intracellular protease/amidase